MQRPSSRLMLRLAGGMALAAILVLERGRPLRRQHYPALPRDTRNLMMGVMCGAVISATETPVTQALARRNARLRLGLAHRLPEPLGSIAAFLVMDYGFYLWHIATHKSDLLWRLHRVHHVDPDMDASTAIRFHLVDMLVSLPWRMMQVRVSGITPRTLDAWQRFFTLSILFHHSNLRLPGRWDERLSWLLTTPRMHGIHHSVVADERDSNWSSGISIWDRAHGTLREDIAQDAVTIGVDDDCALHDVPLEQALRAPFRQARWSSASASASSARTACSAGIIDGSASSASACCAPAIV